MQSFNDKANPPPIGGMIIDNFAGGGGASTGIEMALRRSPDVAINHDPEALCMHEANHPETIHLCESVWDVDIADTVAGRHVALAWFSPDCFLPGTLVLASTGLKPIEEVQIGESVLTHKNRWRKVTSTMTHAVPETVTVRGYGHYGLTTTPRHGFYSKVTATRWPGRKGHDGRSPSAYKELSNIYWPEAKSMEGKLWATPRAIPSMPMPVPDDIALNRDFFYFLGLYIGDGSIARAKENRGGNAITTGDIDLACNKNEFEGLKAHFDASPLCDGNGVAINYRERNSEDATAAHLVWGKQSLADWLATNIGWNCESKQLPLWCLGLQREWRQAILDGYVRADGHECARTETVTVSKALAIGIRLLAVSLDYDVALYFSPGRDTTIEGRPVKGSDAYRVCWRPENQKITTLSDWRHAFYPVREVTDSGPQIVVSLQVDEDESFVADGIVVHNCKHFSKAKGGKPVEKNIRGLAWIVLKWAGIAKPDVIVLENVEEFQSWGPLVDNQPCPRRKGMTFKRWVTQLRNLGYKVDWRELRACDYGAPTIRKRLFVIARRDGKKIVWPDPTHGPAGNLFLHPYRTAAECIDWSIPCPSIFERKRPLAQATLRRIALGIKRYVIDAKEPFIVNLTHGGRLEPLSEPLRTTTTANRGEKAIIVPSLIQTGYGERDGQAPRVPGLDKPLGTLVGTGKHALIAPMLIGAGGSEYAGKPKPVNAPYNTQTTENHTAVVSAFLAKHYGGVVGNDLREPIGTVTSVDHHSLVTSHLVHLKGTCKDGVPVDRPMPTIQAEGTHIGEVRAFLIKYFGTDQDPRLEEPLHTVTSKDRFGLVTIHGEPYQIVDIGMRMLSPRELFRAQGFEDSYIINPDFNGKPLTKTSQVRMCGNSVSPPVAAAIIRAQFSAKAMEKAA